MLWPWITQLRVLGNTGVDNKHKACFGSAAARDSYFLSKVLPSPANLDSYTQLNTEKPIMVEGSYEDLLAADMVTFINNNLGNKRMYARITSKSWVNTNCTLLNLEIDAYTTFMFDISFDGCFVEREMQSGDWAGSYPSNINLTPEQFKCNAYTAAATTFERMSEDNPPIVIAVATEPDGKTPVPGAEYSNMYTGCKYIPCSSAGQANSIIAEYVEQGNLNSIVGVFMAPFSPSAYIYQTVDAPRQPGGMPGYRPANAKILCWPYTYLEAATVNGSVMQYNYAEFADPQNPQFEYRFIPFPNPGILVTPKNYRNLSADYANSLWLDCSLQCTWVGNTFANWQATNGMAMGLQALAGASGAALIAMTSGAATPAVIAGTSALAGSALSAVGQVAAAASTPSMAHGHMSGNGVLYTSNKIGVTFSAITPTASEARRLDSAFNGVGYNTQETKVPNIRTRPHWNYVKTMNATVSGALTAGWIDQIENMLNNGVTFWHIDRGAQIGNYNMGN